MSGIGRVLGHSAPAVQGWVKKGTASPEPFAGARSVVLGELAISQRWWCPVMRCGLAEEPGMVLNVKKGPRPLLELQDVRRTRPTILGRGPSIDPA